MDLIDFHKFVETISSDDLFGAVVYEMLRDQGIVNKTDEEAYELEGKTPEEVEKLKNLMEVAKWIAKNGGPEMGIYRTQEDVDKAFGKSKED